MRISRTLACVFLSGTMLSLANAQNGGPSPSVPGATPAPPATSPSAAPTLADYDAGAVPQAGLDDAKFRWWAPAGVNPRGVLVLIPGRGGDGRGMAGSAEWQTLATKIGFGIVACALINPANNPYHYQNDPNGSVSALIDKAVSTLLTQNKVPLKNPPLVLWGHSAGGNVTQHFCSRYPDRVVAAVLVRATAGPGGAAPGKEEVPMLIFVGKKDKPEWVSSSLDNYEKGHAHHALWTLALNPNEGHEIGKTPPLYAAFITAAVSLRLPPPTFSNETVRPKRLPREAGWLGDPQTYEVSTPSMFHGERRNAVWLLDETTAREWQAYLKGGAL